MEEKSFICLKGGLGPDPNYCPMCEYCTHCREKSDEVKSYTSAMIPDREKSWP